MSHDRMTLVPASIVPPVTEESKNGSFTRIPETTFKIILVTTCINPTRIYLYKEANISSIINSKKSYYDNFENEVNSNLS